MQKICADGNGNMMPSQNEMIFVNDVIVIETAASDIMIPMRSGTSNLTDVRRHAANITNVSSIPIPANFNDTRVKVNIQSIESKILRFVNSNTNTYLSLEMGQQDSNR